MMEAKVPEIDMKIIRELRELKNPSKCLRNLLIVFLTLFHEELADLVADSQESIDEQNEDDPEWATIRSFFASELQTIALIRSVKSIVEKRGITSEYFKKGATILEVEFSKKNFLIGDPKEKFPSEEKKICEAFYDLIIFIYDLEKSYSGENYLRPISPKEEETPKKLLETIHEVENSTFADFSV